MSRLNGKLYKPGKIAFLLLLLIFCAVVISFIVNTTRTGSEEKADPIYIDLMKTTAYLKAGFSPSDAAIAEPDSLAWTAILPPGRGALLPVRWIAGSAENSRKFLAPYDQYPEEYTILIPFEMPSGTIEKLYEYPYAVPGIFLSGIGDNWEIFLNGKTIAENIHLDDRGQITSHRSERDIVFSINRDFLKAGTNILVFRIIGAPNGLLTGLYYASSYYIGEYSSQLSQRANTSTMIFCTVYVFVGLYHLLMFFMRRSDKYNLLYGLFSIVAAIYFICRSAAIYVLTENTAVTQRIEYSAFYLILFLLASFIEQLNFRKLLPVTKLNGVLCTVILILQFAMPLQFAQDLLRVWQVCAVAMILYIFVYDIVITFFSRINVQRQQARSEGFNLGLLSLVGRDLKHTPLGNIFITIIFLFATALFDLLDVTFFHTGVILTGYSFFLFTFIAAMILAREYASSYYLASQMNELLDTTVKERTNELEEQVQIAEKASRAKGDFLANMSHEMRTPINAVVGMTLIGKSAPDIEKKDYCFTKINEASTHLLGVINDILDMSKIEADKLELSCITYNFREIIERVTNVITFKTEEKNQIFSVSVDDSIPEYLIGDDQRLAQVITNLLGNAIKFTPEGGSIGLNAMLEEETGEDCVIRIEVRDSGIGISGDAQAKLFTSFQQADNSTSRTYGGTGLGLAISKRIVELMGGSIWVNSKEGQGSVFGFTIREERAQNSDIDNDAAVADIGVIPNEFENRVALLADDVDINREIVISILEETGLSIETAENGEAALVKFSADPEHFDIILMDVQMPVMDGYTATKRIRALAVPCAKTIPVIAMTANVFKEDVEKSRKSGMNEHIGKPINLTELLRILRKYL